MARRPKSITNKQRQKFAKALDKMNEKWLHKLGDGVLVEAQNLAPVGSGHLKESHKVEYTKDGFKIIVDTPYAHALHEGKTQKKVSGLWKSDIPKHFRLTKNGYVPVRAHIKTYKKGYKPKQITIGGSDDEWRTVQTNPKPKKLAWLQEAWRIVRKRQDPITRKLLQKSLYIEK